MTAETLPPGIPVPRNPFSLLEPAQITLHLTSTLVEDAVIETARLLDDHPQVTAPGQLRSDLLKRFRMHHAILETGITFPHVRTAAVKTFVLAVGRSPAGVVFSSSAQKVRLIFVLGCPQHRPADHLAVVAGISRTLARPQILGQLQAAESPLEFLRLLQSPP